MSESDEIVQGLITDAIQNIMESADEAKAAYEADKEGYDLVNYGRLLGLSEALSAIRASYVGYKPVEEMLDFDIDERYAVT